MIRRFLIEWRYDGPIRDAVWYKAKTNLSLQEVEQHCREHRIGWQKQLFRLFELKPIEVSFETVVNMKEIK